MPKSGLPLQRDLSDVHLTNDLRSDPPSLAIATSPADSQPVSFAALLRSLRRGAGFTQESLALTAGVSVRTIRHLESGSATQPRPSTLLLLAKALGLSSRATRNFIAAAAEVGRSARQPAHLPRGLGSGAIVPAQLPRLIPNLVGRDEDLRALEEATAFHSAVPVVVYGSAGVGKSALVSAWAHSNTDRYPDGQLYVDLRGSAPDGPPLPPEQGLGQLVQALSDPGAALPDGAEERKGLYRSLAAGRRLLVLLDDAASSRQVTDLLPPSPRSTVVVTSRRRLDGLVAEHGAEVIEARPPSVAACLELLARLTGPNFLRTHQEMITKMVIDCGQLPGLLTVVGAQLAASPPRTPESIAKLLDQPRPWRLDAEDLPP